MSSTLATPQRYIFHYKFIVLSRVLKAPHVLPAAGYVASISVSFQLLSVNYIDVYSNMRCQDILWHCHWHLNMERRQRSKAAAAEHVRATARGLHRPPTRPASLRVKKSSSCDFVRIYRVLLCVSQKPWHFQRRYVNMYEQQQQEKHKLLRPSPNRERKQSKCRIGFQHGRRL